MIIGGALADCMGTLVSYCPDIEVHSPYDALNVHIQVGYWTEPTTLWLHHALSDLDTAPSLEEISCTNVVQIEPSPCGSIENTETETPVCNCNCLVTASVASLMNFGDYSEVIRNCNPSRTSIFSCDACTSFCKLYASMIDSALHGRHKDEIINPIYYSNLVLRPGVLDILVNFRNTSINQLTGENTAYDALLMATYCFKKTNSFREGLSMVVNNSLAPKWAGFLYGQIAGAYYGLTDMPENWMDAVQDTISLSLVARRALYRIMPEEQSSA